MKVPSVATHMARIAVQESNQCLQGYLHASTLVSLFHPHQLHKYAELGLGPRNERERSMSTGEMLDAGCAPAGDQTTCKSDRRAFGSRYTSQRTALGRQEQQEHPGASRLVVKLCVSSVEIAGTLNATAAVMGAAIRRNCRRRRRVCGKAEEQGGAHEVERAAWLLVEAAGADGLLQRPAVAVLQQHPHLQLPLFPQAGPPPHCSARPPPRAPACRRQERRGGGALPDCFSLKESQSLATCCQHCQTGGASGVRWEGPALLDRRGQRCTQLFKKGAALGVQTRSWFLASSSMSVPVPTDSVLQSDKRGLECRSPTQPVPARTKQDF